MRRPTPRNGTASRTSCPCWNADLRQSLAQNREDAPRGFFRAIHFHARAIAVGADRHREIAADRSGVDVGGFRATAERMQDARVPMMFGWRGFGLCRSAQSGN